MNIRIYKIIFNNNDLQFLLAYLKANSFPIPLEAPVTITTELAF